MNFRKDILEIVKTYKTVVNVVDKNANEDENRAYGGIVRSVKGKLQEHITEEIINLAWRKVGGNEKRLKINSKKQKIPIQMDYIKKINDREIRENLISKAR